MYEFILKKKTVKRNQVTAFHIIAALILIILGFLTVITPFSLNIFNAGKEHTTQIRFGIVNYFGLLFAIIGIFILVVSIFFNKRYIQKRNNLIIRIIEIICFTIILAYCLFQKYYLPAAYSAAALLGIILAYFIENAEQREIRIEILENSIRMKSKLKDSNWEWHQLENFILKHNVITLHTTEKKMYQFIIEPQPYSTEEVNNYTQSKIKEEEGKRRYDNW